MIETTRFMTKQSLHIGRIYDAYATSAGVCIDTRQLMPGMVFWALKGSHTDGDRYVEEALAKGAAFCVTSDARWKGHPQCEVVKDTLAVLQQLARYRRRQLKVPVIAISGSNGKTTTKALVAAILSRRYRVMASPGNYNNHIGLPLSLLQMRPRNPQVIVVELGINHVGEIEQLLGIAEPTHGILTNIGRDHMGEFGGIEQILKAYQPFIHYFRHRGLDLFWNAEDELSRKAMVGEKKPTDKTISLEDPEADLWGRLIQEVPSLVVRYEKSPLSQSFSVRSPLFGRHHAYNISMAALTGILFHVAIADIQKAIQDTFPVENRGQVIRTHRANTLILDAYNANPDSMRLSLESFVRWPGRAKAVILADMEELGPFAESEHRQIVEWLQQHAWEQVVVVGPHFKRVAPTSPPFLAFETTSSLKEWLCRHPLEGLHILLKGSRKHRLEDLVDIL